MRGQKISPLPGTLPFRDSILRQFGVRIRASQALYRLSYGTWPTFDRSFSVEEKFTESFDDVLSEGEGAANYSRKEGILWGEPTSKTFHPLRNLPDGFATDPTF